MGSVFDFDNWWLWLNQVDFILGYLIGVAVCWWLKERHIRRLETTLAFASLELRSAEQWAEAERRQAIANRRAFDRADAARLGMLRQLRVMKAKRKANK